MRLSEFTNLIINIPEPYQAFTSKRQTWLPHIDENNEAGRALSTIFGDHDEIALSRNDLRVLASNADLAVFVMATIIWGYPRGMRGNHVGNLINHIEDLVKILASARDNLVNDWPLHYNQVRPIQGIGLSTYTKLLSFLNIQVQGQTALILDDRIIRIAKQEIFEELAQLKHLTYQNAPNFYPAYLQCLHGIARQLVVSPEQLELFLFAFGLNLKPIAAP